MKKRLDLSTKQKISLLKIIFSALVLILYFVLKSKPFFTPFLSFLILTFLYLLLGYDVIFGAIRKIFKGRFLDEEFLMCIATIGAYALGDYTEAVGVMLFYKTGSFFQEYSVKKSRNSIKDLMDICPEYANIERDGKLIRVMPEEVSIGDIIIVKPGEKIALDGIVAEGFSYIDTSSVTGESMKKETGVGDRVYNGTVNLKSVIKVKVTEEFENSTVSKILELVENSAFNKSKSENFITRFSRVYTPFVVICALVIAFLFPLIFGSFALWFKRSLIFLVISCPCALVISVPLSFFASIGCGSKHGILFKGSSYIETLARVKTVVFDKTGTLTKGIFKIKSVIPSENTDTDFLIECLSACEYYSDHPLAEIVKKSFPEPDLSLVSSFENVEGCGVKIIYKNAECVSGKASFVSNYADSSFEDSDLTSIHVAYDGKYLGKIEMSDTVKGEAKETIKTLKEKRIKTVMLTGDNENTAREIAKELGIDYFKSDLLPQDKTSIIEDLKNKNPKGYALAFVGDGINDAPSLKISDVGISMGSIGSDAAIEASDVVITDDNISKINTAIIVSKKTLSIVKQNIAFSLIIKVLTMILGTLGFANMWMAVFADVGVAFIAILNSMRMFKL